MSTLITEHTERINTCALLDKAKISSPPSMYLCSCNTEQADLQKPDGQLGGKEKPGAGSHSLQLPVNEHRRAEQVLSNGETRFVAGFSTKTTCAHVSAS